MRRKRKSHVIMVEEDGRARFKLCSIPLFPTCWESGRRGRDDEEGKQLTSHVMCVTLSEKGEKNRLGTLGPEEGRKKNAWTDPQEKARKKKRRKERGRPSR